MLYASDGTCDLMDVDDNDYFQMCSTSSHCFSHDYDTCDKLMDCPGGDDESSDEFGCEGNC